MIYKLAQGKTLADLEKRGFEHVKSSADVVMQNKDGWDDYVVVAEIGELICGDTTTSSCLVIVAECDDSPTIESLLKLGIIEPKR